VCHRDVDEGRSRDAPSVDMHEDATSLRPLDHGLQTKKLRHIDCHTTMRRAGGRHAAVGYAGAALA
jgi:hypothetical protein